MVYKIGVVDTTFSRVDMATAALEELRKRTEVSIVRRTVPGIKDIAVECKRLLDGGCDACLALGWVGGEEIDAQCAHEASLGIQWAKLLTGKHIVEAFVHEREANSAEELRAIAVDRAAKHAVNAYLLVAKPEELTKHAGTGIRQGKQNAGPLLAEVKGA